MQMSLVEMPSFSFNINVYGGDITFLPGVEKWINWFIETRVLRPYVLPERLTVPVKFLYDPTLQVCHHHHASLLHDEFVQGHGTGATLPLRACLPKCCKRMAGLCNSIIIMPCDQHKSHQ